MEVCVELFSGSDTATTTAINATLTTSESSPGEKKEWFICDYLNVIIISSLSSG